MCAIYSAGDHQRLSVGNAEKFLFEDEKLISIKWKLIFDQMKFVNFQIMKSFLILFNCDLGLKILISKEVDFSRNRNENDCWNEILRHGKTLSDFVEELYVLPSKVVMHVLFSINSSASLLLYTIPFMHFVFRMIINPMLFRFVPFWRVYFMTCALAWFALASQRTDKYSNINIMSK